MKKLNILILVDKFDYHGSYINGPMRYYSWLFKRIDKKIFNIYLSTLRSKGKSDEIFKRENIKVKYLNLGKYNPLTFIHIVRLILKKKIDE